MKKSINITIGGSVFYIEEDGYEKLKGYLDSITDYFSHYEDNKEIVEDIESRIAEIFTQNIQDSQRQALTLENVENLITKMGTIADFKAEGEEEPDTAHANKKEENKHYQENNQTIPPSKKLTRNNKAKIIGGVCAGVGDYFGIDPLWVRLFCTLLFLNFIFPQVSSVIFITYIILWIVLPLSHNTEENKIKKMFRNVDNKVIAGVASGISSYFGVDVIIIRLVFVFSILAGGVGIVAYIILWAITPEAKSVTEKMQMKGDPITLSNIETRIKENIGEKEKDGIWATILLLPFRVLSAIFNWLGKLGKPFIRAIGILIGLGLIFCSFIAIFAITVVFGTFWGITYELFNTGWLHSNVPEIDIFLFNDTPYLLIIALFSCIMIPIFGVFFSGISCLIHKWIIPKFLSWFFIILWFFSLMVLCSSIPYIVKEFKKEDSVVETKTYPQQGNITYFKVNELDHFFDFSIEDEDDNNMFFIESFEIKPSKNDYLSSYIEIESQGKSDSAARENARMTSYTITQKDSIFYFDDGLRYKPGAKYRGQRVKITFYIPYNRKFKVLDKKTGVFLHKYLHYDHGFSKKQYKNTHNIWYFDEKGNLKNEIQDTNEQDYNEHEEEDVDTYESNFQNNFKSHENQKPVYLVKKFHIKDYDHIKIGGVFIVSIQQGYCEKISVTSNKEMLEHLKIEKKDNTLELQILPQKSKVPIQRDKIFVDITLPTLKKITMDEAPVAKIYNFYTDTLDISLSGISKLYAHVHSQKTSVDINQKATLFLRGETDNFSVFANGNSDINAFPLRAQTAQIYANGKSKTYIHADNILTVKSKGMSQVFYKGNAQKYVFSSELSHIKPSIVLKHGEKKKPIKTT